MKINDLKNKHIGKNVVILTCGPSLKEYPKDKILNFIKNKIVICIKESIIEYKEHAHYFFANGTRERAFDILDKTVKIYQKGLNKKKMNYDLEIEEDRPFTWENRLLLKKNFEKYDFDNFEKRPWGPGILYESVFYLCKYMGCKNIYTIGWDLIDTSKQDIISHFFDKSNEKEYQNSKRWNKGDSIKSKHLEEMILVNQNIPHMYKYLKSFGVNLIVVGEKSYVNKIIERIKL